MNEKLSAADRAYAHLHDAILFNEVPPDGRLRETHIAKELDLSRTPVREAIDRLEREGLVVQENNRGASVAIPSIEEADQLYELRELLEGHAVYKAATSRSSSDVKSFKAMIRESQEVLKRFRAAKLTRLEGELYRRWIEKEREFHELIVNLAGNKWIQDIITKTDVLSRVFRVNRNQPSTDQGASMAFTISNHIDIIKAIEDRDAKQAKKSMLKGLRVARNETREKAGLAPIR